MADPGLFFGVLGPLTVVKAGTPVAIGGPKERLVLAQLLARANSVVSTDALVDGVWSGAPPRSAERTLQAYVARLRHGLEPERAAGAPHTVLVSTGAGYRLQLATSQSDALRFEVLARQGADQLRRGDEGAGRSLRQALELWRGEPYGEFGEVDSCASEARRLGELRVVALEDRLDADLAAGGGSDLVAELESAVADHPFRERFWCQLMLALYRAGRQRDALATYQRARSVLIEELGLDPGPELRGLEAAILEQDPKLDPVRPAAGGPHSVLPLPLDAVGPAFFGREAELAWLQAAWADTVGGRGGFVSVLGPEGIGKTRLVAEFARWAQSTGAVVLYGRCDHTHRGARALLDQSLRSGGSSLSHVDGGESPFADLAGAVARFLPTWAQGQAVLLALDDLHLADADTLEVVADLAGWSGAGRTLIVAAFRTDTAGATPSAVGTGAATQVTLAGLDRKALGQLCTIYAPDEWLSDDIDRLYDLTGGVPLQVHEQASEWARQRATRRVEEAADRSTVARLRLAASRGEIADSVEGIQHLLEERRANLAARVAELGAGPDIHPFELCPYKGLAAFEAADAASFFGRERLVAELVARLASARLLCVVGPSGSGKSSLVRAGLLPALAAGVIPVSGGWSTVVLTPGARPAHELLRRVSGAGEVAGRRLVFVDQFEEAFTHCADNDELARFVDQLIALTGRADTVVVLAVRADYLGHCAALSELAELMTGNDVLVGPMRDSELRRAIELPARRVGFVIEPGLVDVIVADVAGRPGALPLLSTALAETWERRTDRTLTLAGYRAAGGVSGALARMAEDAYQALGEGPRAAARRLLLRLCDAGDDGALDLRRRLPLVEVAGVGDDDAQTAVEALVARRLLTVDGDSAEVAHEALLREWPRLRAWLDEDVQGRRLQRRMRDAARAWRAGGEDPSELYRGTRLDAALDWAGIHDADLNESEQVFLDASRQEAAREIADANRRTAEKTRSNRRLRALLGGVAALLVVALVAGALALRQRNRAEAATRASTARELASASTLALDEDPELSILLALEAIEATDTPLPEAISALQQAVQTSRMLVRADDGGYRLDATRDGGFLVTASSDDLAEAIVWDASTASPLRSLAGPTPIQDLAFSPDGSLVAIGYDQTLSGKQEPGLIVWNPATGAEVARLPGEGRRHYPEAFSPDGQFLAAGSVSSGSPDRMTLWDVDAEQERFSIEPKGGVGQAEFLPDGLSFVVAEPNGQQVARYSADDGQQLQVLATAGFDPQVLALDPSGRLLAMTSQPSQAAELWDLDTGQREWFLDGGDGGEPSWSPDGDRLAIGGANESQIRVVDAASGNDVMVLHGHESGSFDVAFLADGERLASVGQAGGLRIWDVSPDGPPALHSLAPSGDPSQIAFLPDSTQTIVATWDGTVERVDAATGGTQIMLAGQLADLFIRPTISPDGRRMGSVDSATGRAVIRDTSTLEPVDVLPLCSNPKAFSPDASRLLLDGRMVCTSDMATPRFQPVPDSELRSRVIDLASGSEIVDLGERVVYGAFSPDGRYLAVGAKATGSEVLELYDLSTRHLVSSRRFPVSAPFSLAFDPQSRWLAGGMIDGSVWVLDLAAVAAGTPQAEAVIFERVAHDAGVVGLGVSRDGVVASAARGEGLVRLWDIDTGKRLLELRTNPGPAAYPIAQFSADGAYVTYDDGGVLRRYLLDTDELIELAHSRLTRGFTVDECEQYLDPDRCS